MAANKLYGIIYMSPLKLKLNIIDLKTQEIIETASSAVFVQEKHKSSIYRHELKKIVAALAAALGTTVDYLLSSADVYTLTAQEKGGASAARDIEELVSEVTGLFAGGQLSEDALEGAMRALNDAYWQAKEKNKKYTPKKYRHADQ